MGAVDAMKRLQGWSDTNVIHFSDLAKFGERLLLSVRHVRWDAITDPLAAQDWALSWRREVQGYIHAYRMATGVMLSDDVVDISGPGLAALRAAVGASAQPPDAAAAGSGGAAAGSRQRAARAAGPDAHRPAV